MSDFPYTDEQVDRVMACYREAFRVHGMGDAPDECWRDETHALLAALSAAGITVTFPKPRYVVEAGGRDHGAWSIIDTEIGRPPLCTYWRRSGGDVGAEACAREHADRLNREATA